MEVTREVQRRNWLALLWNVWWRHCDSSGWETKNWLIHKGNTNIKTSSITIAAHAMTWFSGWSNWLVMNCSGTMPRVRTWKTLNSTTRWLTNEVLGIKWCWIMSRKFGICSGTLKIATLKQLARDLLNEMQAYCSPQLNLITHLDSILLFQANLPEVSNLSFIDFAIHSDLSTIWIDDSQVTRNTRFW